MTEYSYPRNEEPLPAKDWSDVTKGIGNGILDQGGFPYQLTSFNNATNTAALKAAVRQDGTVFSSAILEGFIHKMTEDITIDLPAVTSRKTYYVALQYDPVRAEEQGVPVVAGAWTSLDYTGGKNYLHLWNVTRNANELLTDAAVRMIRPRIATTSTYAHMDDLPLAHKVLWGSIAFIHSGRANDDAKIVMSMNDNNNDWYWKTIYDPEDQRFVWSVRSDTGTYANPGHGFQRAIGRRGKTRRFRGRVSRTTGALFSASNQDGYQVWSGSLASGDAPAAVQRFTVAAGGASAATANVEVSSTGAVTAWVSKNVYWLSLDGIEWEAK